MSGDDERERLGLRDFPASEYLFPRAAAAADGAGAPSEAPRCPYGSGADRERGEILAVRAWHVPTQHRIGVMTPVCAVLVSGSIGDYAVYLGVGHPAWVREHGNKLSFDDAAGLFPGLVEGRYRE